MVLIPMRWPPRISVSSLSPREAISSMPSCIRSMQILNIQLSGFPMINGWQSELAAMAATTALSSGDDPLRRGIGGIRVRTDEVRPATDEEGRPLDHFIIKLVVEGGDDSADICIGQDKTGIRYQSFKAASPTT